MYKLTKNLFLLVILFFSCGNTPEKSAKLISPSENLRITTSSKYIFESNTLQLSENEIEAYHERGVFPMHHVRVLMPEKVFLSIEHVFPESK